MKTPLGKTPDGREFPVFNGELLSWCIGSYQTRAEEQADFPRMRAVIRAALQHGRRAMVESERRDMVKASFDRLFGHNARTALRIIEEELSNANAL